MQRRYSLASAMALSIDLRRPWLRRLLPGLVAGWIAAGCGGASPADESDAGSHSQPMSQYKVLAETAEPSASDLLPEGTREQVELRVLLITIGDIKVDPGRQLMEALLQQLGVPYDVLDSSREELSAKRLRDGKRGRYNGIILTSAETFLPSMEHGFDREQFELLFAYEREYGVREAVLGGFPANDETFGIDYGMKTAKTRKNVVARWTNADSGLFGYVNAEETLTIVGSSFAAKADTRQEGPVVTPLLVNDDNPAEILISHLAYPDGRQVLLSSVPQGDWLLHSQLIAYEFLNFATSGLFLGARRHYLVIHNDDMFYASLVWDPETNMNFEKETSNFRLSPAEVESVVEAQQQFQQMHPLAAQVVTQLAFNAIGSEDDDPLTKAIVQYREHFGFINHTYEALQLDRSCGLSGPAGCPRTSYETIYDEIEKNAQAWEHFGFPDAESARYAMLPDSHSGLMDRNGTQEPEDDIPFPWGFNPALGEAAEAIGIKVIAGDHSRLNQDLIRRIPDYDVALLPRYPTSVYFNVTNPMEMTSEYNYVHHYRYLEEGEDPCEVTGAVCEPRSYEEILEAEVDVAMRHIFSYTPFPHYFHQCNLHVYDDEGHILQFDWQEAVLKAYERWSTLPLESPDFHELADIALQVIEQRESGAAGFVDRSTGEVTLVSRRPASIQVTGLAGGDLYGGQSQRVVDLSKKPRTFELAETEAGDGEGGDEAEEIME